MICERHPERSQATEGPDAVTAKAGGCAGCLDEQHGFELQTSVDSGREGIRCGVCGCEVDYGIVTDAAWPSGSSSPSMGLHALCIARICLYLTARGIVLW